ncbi:MAG: bifunctional rhamnulose-1-phosphate aldolase/short-chain dehydrogenase [Bryobacteraceae bacterium]|nr:bifunctional rhamnulose-1-phosphate aldolase/short-chain dehydrogenase [Bryobacteraceae bacterium]
MKFLKDLWNETDAASLAGDPLELLRYRSNLLGADLRITNFGGGNTSSKFDLTDPFTGKPARVMAVKGSGGDLGSIKAKGFAVLYLDKLLGLEGIYRGEQFEDEMVAYYPLCAFGASTAPPSIDTPLHAYLPAPHVDHLHPDWAIALAASANGPAKMAEFNQRYGHKLAWLRWQRPGFELGLMLRRAVEENPGCDGIVLGSHGLFTWGETQRECYLNSLRMIDELGEFITDHEKGRKRFGGAKYQTLPDAAERAAEILPYLRGRLATTRRTIAHYNAEPDVLEFVNAEQGPALAALGTSCPDHFIRTRIKPLLVEWNPQAEDMAALRAKIDAGADAYRRDYAAYYEAQKEDGSPALRDANPSVVLIPGLGMFTFAKNKTEARITGEFYLNAIHVMAGATALAGGETPRLPAGFTSYANYVALPPREAFRIEYWALEEAKIQRMPPEQEMSRRIFLVVGGGSGIGRAVALKLVENGAHLMVADINGDAASETVAMCTQKVSKEAVACCHIDITKRESVAAALRRTAAQFGGVDGVINTAAVFLPPSQEGVFEDDKWRTTLDINVTGNWLLADEAGEAFRDQNLPATIVLTGSANAVVAKRGSEAYDVSKSAVNHLIRSLAIGQAPLVRVNGIAPATVVDGSAMFPRERLIPSLKKYDIPFEETDTTEELRHKLAEFYAQRTLSKRPITPRDCAEAIYWLASERSAKTTGHVLPVDGGLPEAFLR